MAKINEYNKKLKSILKDSYTKDLSITFNFPYKSGLPTALRNLFTSSRKEHISSDSNKFFKQTIFTEILLPDSEKNILQNLHQKINNYAANEALRIPSDHEDFSWKSLERNIRILTKSNKFNYVLISVINASFLWEDNANLIAPLISLNSSLKNKLQFAFSIINEIKHPANLTSRLGDLYPYIFTNFEYFGLMDNNLISKHLDCRLETIDSKALPQKVHKQIISLSGGHVGLALSLLRIFVNTNKIPSDIKEIIKYPEIDYILNKLWHSLHTETREDILKLDDLSDIQSEFLIQTDLLNKSRNAGWFSDLFAEYIELNKNEGITKKNLQPKSKGTSKQLTWQEKEVFDLLKRNLNNTIDREMIAKAIWKEDWSQKYSDWAIEQIIKNIRKKLKNQPTIKTVYGKGYSMISS